MALTDIGLANRALVRLGAETIASFTDDTVAAEIAGTLYTSARDDLLSAHPWHFATGQVALSELGTSPVADFAKAYALPNDFLRAMAAGSGGRGRGIVYRLTGGELHTNADSVILTYIFRPDESVFPPFFDAALITRLAAEFCIPLTENTSRSETLFRLAEQAFIRAKQIDSQQDSPARIDGFPLITSRF